MGHIIRRILAVGFVLGFGGGGLLWVLGDPAAGKSLILLGAILGLCWSFVGAMMSPIRVAFNIIWLIAFGYMIARSTIWKDIQPDSPESNAMFRILDANWEYIRIGVMAYVILYVITLGQSIMVTRVRRSVSRYPVYPSFEYEHEHGQPESAQPAVEAPPQRESLMQRRQRHLKIRKLLRNDQDIEAAQLLRPGEYFDGDDVVDYD